MRRWTFSSGQILLEVSVMLGVVLLLVTGLVAATTATLKKGRLAQDRSIATKYAQEGMEMTRLFRNKGWSDFRKLNDVACQNDEGTCLWCLNANGDWSVLQPVTNECSNNIDNRYSRLVFFDWKSDPDPNKEHMHVTVIVAWQDGVNVYRSNVESDFTEWQ